MDLNQDLGALLFVFVVFEIGEVAADRVFCCCLDALQFGPIKAVRDEGAHRKC